MPYGGHLRWTYADYTYPGSRTQRKVYNRYLSISSGAPELTYTVAHETTTPSTAVQQNIGLAAEFARIGCDRVALPLQVRINTIDRGLIEALLSH
ncbi:MAG: hypothetical protein ACRD40_01430 [Candidatus Acidiferrales bacterium]